MALWQWVGETNRPPRLTTRRPYSKRDHGGLERNESHVCTFDRNAMCSGFISIGTYKLGVGF